MYDLIPGVNWNLLVAVLIIAIPAVIAVWRILKPASPWIQVLVFILDIIERLAPEIKAKVKAGMYKLDGPAAEALNKAVATVDEKKATPPDMKKFKP